MREQVAEATVEKLENDKRVRSAKIDRNSKGVFVAVDARDRMAARDLKGDLGEYPVYVEVRA